MKKLLLGILVICLLSTLSRAQNSNQNYYSAQTNPTLSVLTDQGMNPVYPWSGPSFKSALETALLPDSSHVSTYDTVGSAFKLVIRTYYSLDSGGLVIQKLNKSIDKNGIWRNYSIDTLTYTGPLISRIVTRQWDAPQALWKNALKYDYFYDTLNVLNSIIISNWSTTHERCDYTERESFTYNNASQVLVDLHQSWNDNLSTWENLSRTTNTYSSGKLSGSLYEQWINSSLSWSPYTRSTYSYTSGLKTGVTTEKYLTSSSTWENLEKVTISYTSSNLEEMITTQNWISGQWVNARLTSYTYTEGQIASELNKLWQAHLNDWRNSQLTDIYYSNHEVFGIKEHSVSARMLPNPLEAGSVVRISGLLPDRQYQVRITGTDGRTVMMTKAANNDQITIPRVNSGMYIIAASSPGKPLLVQKILIFR